MRNNFLFYRGSINSCCKDCTEKFEACHDVCATYLQAKAEYEEQKARIKEARRQAHLWDDFHYDSVSRMKKTKASKGGR